MQLPLEPQKALYWVFCICRNTPQDLWTHFDVQNWWPYPVIHWAVYCASSVSLRLMRWFESHVAFPDKGSNLHILASHALWVKESLKLHTENWEETLSDTVCKCWLRFLSCRKFYYQLYITSMFDTRMSMFFFFFFSRLESVNLCGIWLEEPNCQLCCNLAKNYCFFLSIL